MREKAFGAGGHGDCSQYKSYHELSGRDLWFCCRLNGIRGYMAWENLRRNVI